MWKEVMPDECEGIAQQYEKAASEIRNIASRVRTAGTSINQSWNCPAKEVFDEGFSPMPRHLEEYADQLRRLAADVRKIRVQKWFPDD